MFTTYGKKRQSAQGWLGNKLKVAQVQGSKFLKHPVTKTVAAVALTAGGMYAASKKEEKQQERIKDSVLLSLPRGNVEETSMVEASPFLSDWFANTTPEEKKALGILEGGIQTKIKSISELEWDRTKIK